MNIAQRSVIISRQIVSEKTVIRTKRSLNPFLEVIIVPLSDGSIHSLTEYVQSRLKLLVQFVIA